MLTRFWTIVVIGVVAAGCPTLKEDDDREGSPDSGIVEPGPEDTGVQLGVDSGFAVDEDGGVDAGFAPDATTPSETTVQGTGGGGRAASGNYRARIVVGAPAPMGAGRSADYRAVIGTGGAQAGQ